MPFDGYAPVLISAVTCGSGGGGGNVTTDQPFIGPTQHYRLVKAIALLERGLARVEKRYTSQVFYQRKGWWHASPAFCMRGALYRADSGDQEPFSNAHILAETFLLRQTGGNSLIAFGSYGRRPFAQKRVIRAYRQALAAAIAASFAERMLAA